MEQKKRGFENLLEAGIPAGKMYGCMSLSKPTMKDFRQTIDWFVDQVGVKNFFFSQLEEILRKNYQELLFHDPVEGYCGEECENRDVCFGCRANAHHYLGDRRASDPKCWLNPRSPELETRREGH